MPTEILYEQQILNGSTFYTLHKHKDKIMHKARDLIYNILFVLAFMFVASGMLECCVIKLLELWGW